MRILITATSLLPVYGGPAFSVSRLAAALVDEGADISLWAADGSAPGTSLVPRSSPVKRLSGSVRDAVFSGRFHIIHDNGIWLPHNHSIARLAAGLGICRIVSTRGMLEPWARRHKKWKKSAAWHLYQRQDLRKAQCCHVATAVEAANIEALGLEVAIRVVPNGMDMPARPEAPKPEKSTSGKRTALFLGRIYPVKGLPMLIRAWSEVRPVDWRLVIAGPDEAGHRAEIETMITAAGLGQDVEFAGELLGDVKAAAYRNSELFILPSHSESFGMAIAEALAHGVPALTTMGAPWPQLQTYRCGWRTEISADGIAAALREALELAPDTLAEMGRRGAELIRREFAWNGVARRMLGVYAEFSTPFGDAPGVFAPVPQGS